MQLAAETARTAAPETIPHVATFQALLQGIGKHRAYLNPDEVIRKSRRDSQKMRFSLDIKQPLEERQRACALLDWHVECEDKDDAGQKLIANRLTKIIGRIRNFTAYRLALLEAIFFGRYAVANTFGVVDQGDHSQIHIVDWKPIHGDKLTFDDKDNVGVRVGMAVPPEFQVDITVEGRVHFFSPETRPLYVVHKHQIEDGIPST